MKTICPHCNQEYLETPDEYLGMTLQCSVCQKEFVCEKAKFCPECGAINPAKALKCGQCGKFFPVMPPGKGAVEQPISPPDQSFSRTSGNYDADDSDSNSGHPALKSALKFVIFLIVFGGLAAGGYQTWKFVKNKLQQEEAAAELKKMKAKAAAELKILKAKDAAALKKLKAVVIATENYQLGRGLNGDREVRIRTDNAERFLKEVNSILRSAGYPVLDKDFQYDFKQLTIYNHCDAYDTLNLLKLRSKLSAAATVAEFCDAAKKADLPIETKEKLVAEFFYVAGKGDSARQAAWKLRERMIAVLRKRHEKNKEALDAGKSYLDKQIRELKEQAFRRVRNQLSKSSFDSWNEAERDGDAKDRSVLQNALKNESIHCKEFGLNKVCSFSDLTKLQKETAELSGEMRLFIPENKHFLRGVVLFPDRDSHPWFTTKNGCLIDRMEKKLLYVIPTKDGKFTIPADVESVSDDAFIDCEDFIVISPTRIIRKRASWNKQDLETLKNGELVNTDKLQKVVIPAGTTELESGIFDFCYNLVSVTIPSGVTRIGKDAFSYCSRLKEIVLPTGIESIGDGAFENSGLTSVVIPEGVKSIGKNAFNNCSKLKEVVLPQSIESIGDGAFKNSGLVSVTIPSGVTCISKEAFAYCRDLKEIVLPTGIKSVGDGAFENSGLSSVVIPEGVKSIGKKAFAYCRDLKEIVLPQDIKSIGDGAFEESGLVSVTVPYGVTRIGDRTFRLCPSLKEIILPTGIESIGEEAFRACGLTSVVIPEGVKSIGKEAFAYCRDLKEIILPTGIKSIGDRAFEECPGRPAMQK